MTDQFKLEEIELWVARKPDWQKEIWPSQRWWASSPGSCCASPPPRTRTASCPTPLFTDTDWSKHHRNHHQLRNVSAISDQNAWKRAHMRTTVQEHSPWIRGSHHLPAQTAREENQVGRSDCLCPLASPPPPLSLYLPPSIDIVAARQRCWWRTSWLLRIFHL